MVNPVKNGIVANVENGDVVFYAPPKTTSDQVGGPNRHNEDLGTAYGKDSSSVYGQTQERLREGTGVDQNRNRSSNHASVQDSLESERIKTNTNEQHSESIQKEKVTIETKHSGNKPKADE